MRDFLTGDKKDPGFEGPGREFSGQLSQLGSVRGD